MKTVLRTRTGHAVTLDYAREADHCALHEAFQRVILTGNGYPQFQAPLTLAAFQDYWLADKSVVIVAYTQDGEIAGSYWLKPNFLGRAAHIANGAYFVREDMHDAGIGRLLLEHSLDKAKGYGFDALMFNLVFKSNESAGHLYRDCGFECIGTIPDVIGKEPAEIYWRAL